MNEMGMLQMDAIDTRFPKVQKECALKQRGGKRKTKNGDGARVRLGVLVFSRVVNQCSVVRCASVMMRMMEDSNAEIENGYRV